MRIYSREQDLEGFLPWAFCHPQVQTRMGSCPRKPHIGGWKGLEPLQRPYGRVEALPLVKHHMQARHSVLFGTPLLHSPKPTWCSSSEFSFPRVMGNTMPFYQGRTPTTRLPDPSPRWQAPFPPLLGVLVPGWRLEALSDHRFS